MFVFRLFKKTLGLILWLIVIAAGILAFLAFYKPELFQDIKNEAVNKAVEKTEEYFPEAKISAPLEESEFEKTKSYGTLDCQNYQANTFAVDMFDRINADRVKNGKKKLEWNPKLCESAKLKSQDMNANNYFEHISPSGVTPWYWFKKIGYNYTFSGENLALNYFTSESAHTALMNSPGHRENILNENFTQIGFYYLSGSMDGKDAFFFVEHFASPAPAKPQYVCEIDKANKNLEDMKDQKNKIEKYIDKAEDIKDELKKAGQSTKEVDEYIDDMQDKEKEIDKYIKELKDYLEKCKN